MDADARVGRLSSYSVSIVVSILEPPRVLEYFFHSLRFSINDGQQLIFVDDGNSSESKRIIAAKCRELDQFHDVVLIENSKTKSATASLEFGIAKAENDLIAQLDADIILKQGWLRGLVNGVESSDDIGVCSGCLFYPESNAVNLAGMTFHEMVGRHLFLNAKPDYLSEKKFAVQASPMGFSLMRRDAFDLAGGFDPMYFHGYDDLDLSLKIRSLGKRVLIVPQAQAWHWERSAGPGRDAGRKRNLAVFWSKWHDFLKNDLFDFLLPSLKRLLDITGQSRLLGIDLAQERIGAESFWLQLRHLMNLDIEVQDHSLHAQGQGAISLPLVLGPQGPVESRNYLFLVDNIVRVGGNRLFSQIRSNYSPDDIVVDFHGNALRLIEIGEGDWPGNRIR